MKSVIKSSTDREIKITEGKREFIFYFKDGNMVATKSNLPFEKSKSDWKFYSKAIAKMLEDSKGFYVEQLTLSIRA